MEEEMNSWPNHYPEACPPIEAEEVSGKVYRFTNRNNPKHKDFQSHYEQWQGRDWGSKACDARGLSVFSCLEDCDAAAAAVPALRKKKICVAKLPTSSGVLAETPSRNTNNHKTLWPLLSAQELADLFTPINSAVNTNV